MTVAFDPDFSETLSISDAPMVGVFGGTFDPIHFGHLRTVSAVKAKLALPRILIVPAHIPPHRPPPVAAPEHRLSMIKLAVEKFPAFECDDREIRRGGISYTVLTVHELRQELDQKPLCLIVGLDSFLDLPHWHRWTEILQNAHIIVMHRPGWDIPSTRPSWWRDAEQDDPDRLLRQPGGSIYCTSVPEIDLNSTEIRKRLGGTNYMKDALRPTCSTTFGPIDSMGNATPTPDESAGVLRLIVNALDEAKAQDVRQLDVRKLTDITDFMIIASGTSHRHVHAMAERLREVTHQRELRPIGVEGEAENDWILMDYAHVVVHLMMPQVREFYSLERLWNDHLSEEVVQRRRDSLSDS